MELLKSSKINLVFHVSYMMVIGQIISTQLELPKLDKEGRIILDHKGILQTHSDEDDYGVFDQVEEPSQ